MNAAADLELTIGEGSGDVYPVEVRFTAPEPDAIEFRDSGRARICPGELGEPLLNEEAYGEALWKALFADERVGRTFEKCRALAHARNLPLRLRLYVVPNDPALHRLRWELLRDPGAHSWLAADERTLFSRYLASTVLRPTPRPPRQPADVRALVFIADPDNLGSYSPGGRQLAPVDVAGEGGRARKALGEITPREVSRLARPEPGGGPTRATLAKLVEEVRGGCDFLYLVCHGALVDGEPVLYLENPEGRVDAVRGAELVRQLEGLQALPRLVVLASCQSAGNGKSSSTDEGALAALGPRLARAGVPAVLAMQGDVTMATVEAFMPVFFRELLRDGQVDRAVAAARAAVARHRPDDWWVPALSMRLAGGNLWSEAPPPAAPRLEDLLAYLDALAAEAERVPAYYPRGARMGRVRVRVRVSSERHTYDRASAEQRERLRRLGLPEESAGRVYRHRLSPDGPVGEGGDGGEAPRVEVLDWDRDVRDKLRRGVLVGDPGLGKTWVLKWDAARRAAEAARQLGETRDLAGVVLPVYRRLTDVASALHTLEERRKHVADAPVPTLADAVIESLRRWELPAPAGGTSRPLPRPLLDMLRGRLGGERAVLLLDAFDEVPEDRRQPLLDSLREWVPRNPQARVLFTSRVVGYQQPWPVPEGSESEREMELLPFADDQVAEFVDAFFAAEAEAARELRELLRRAPPVRGMAQIPLLLGFLCALYREERARPAGERRDLARLRRTDLYRTVLLRLLSGRWKDPPRVLPEGEADAKLELLEPVAFRLFLAGKEQFTLRELKQAVRSAHAELHPGQALTEVELPRRVREWAEEDGVLVRAGAGEDAPYLFLHLTFQEYLAARHLAGRINDSGWDGALVPLAAAGRTVPAREFVDRKAWLPAWQEVIVLLAGSLHDPVPLLELLSDDAKDDIFRHRLALAALCLTEIEELLDGS